ncbi:thioredoxin family protein [Mesomycoplasma lagogenitalium]|uniref:Thioredoxin n=1 Tax=Mesomycoplasma lagogenitalium TaxID=171286 RepID=A0ABY8LWU6_9BACT|nr:thioredoxin family protein [Mesomycoplasma lagogenitalium]WGI36886.1 thioredoxin family protein [Mesomycoplasma lagogenitalium]
MFVKDVTKATLENQIKDGNGVQLLNFHATWCGPCKMMAPVLKEVADKLNIQVFKVDVDQDINFAREMKISGTPTTFIYKNGKLASMEVGYRSYDQLARILKSFM